MSIHSSLGVGVDFGSGRSIPSPSNIPRDAVCKDVNFSSVEMLWLKNIPESLLPGLPLARMKDLTGSCTADVHPWDAVVSEKKWHAYQFIWKMQSDILFYWPIHTYSWHVEKLGYPRREQPATRSPSFKVDTPGPHLSTTPDASQPSTNGHSVTRSPIFHI